MPKPAFFPDFFFFRLPCHLLFSVPCGHCPTGPGSTEDQRTWVPFFLAMPPTAHPGAALPPTDLSPRCCPECPSGQDTGGSSPGRAGASHTRMSGRGGRQRAHTRVHTCLCHARTGQGGGRPGTLGADMTYFSFEASRVAQSPRKSLIELGVNYSSPDHVNACAKGFFSSKKNLLYNLKPHTLPSPGPNCSPGCFRFGEQSCETWTDLAGAGIQAGAGMRAGARFAGTAGGGMPWGRGWQPCSGSGSPQQVASWCSRAQPSPFPGTVASGAIFRPAFCFFLFFSSPCSSPLLSAALEALGREENADPWGGKLRGRALATPHCKALLS